MYTGTLIEDLITTVERVEKQNAASRRERSELDDFYMLAQPEMLILGRDFMGVA